MAKQKKSEFKNLSIADVEELTGQKVVDAEHQNRNICMTLSNGVRFKVPNWSTPR